MNDREKLAHTLNLVYDEAEGMAVMDEQFLPAADALLVSEWLAARDQEAKAEAWDEGHRTTQEREMDDCNCAAWNEGECACGLYGTGKIVTRNPYKGDPNAD